MSLECAILVGLPGAGKSTFYRARLSGTHVLVSKDLYPQGANRQARMLRDIARVLGEGRSVAVDNTNPSRRDRAPIIDLARAYGARTVAYHVRATTREAVARNEGRMGSGRVPKVAIFTVARRLEPPVRDEPGPARACQVYDRRAVTTSRVRIVHRDGATFTERPRDVAEHPRLAVRAARIQILADEYVRPAQTCAIKRALAGARQADENRALERHQRS